VRGHKKKHLDHSGAFSLYLHFDQLRPTDPLKKQGIKSNFWGIGILGDILCIRQLNTSNKTPSAGFIFTLMVEDQ